MDPIPGRIVALCALMLRRMVGMRCFPVARERGHPLIRRGPRGRGRVPSHCWGLIWKAAGRAPSPHREFRLPMPVRRKKMVHRSLRRGPPIVPTRLTPHDSLPRITVRHPARATRPEMGGGAADAYAGGLVGPQVTGSEEPGPLTPGTLSDICGDEATPARAEASQGSGRAAMNPNPGPPWTSAGGRGAGGGRGGTSAPPAPPSPYGSADR